MVHVGKYYAYGFDRDLCGNNYQGYPNVHPKNLLTAAFCATGLLRDEMVFFHDRTVSTDAERVGNTIEWRWEVNHHTSGVPIVIRYSGEWDYDGQTLTARSWCDSPGVAAYAELSTGSRTNWGSFYYPGFWTSWDTATTTDASLWKFLTVPNGTDGNQPLRVNR